MDWAYSAFPIGKKPKIEWKNYRVTAGMAQFSTWAIFLSKNVLISKTQVQSTLLHEYAHLLAVYRHGKKAANHGHAWQKAMLDLGQEPKVTHHYSVKRNKGSDASIEYVCCKCGRSIMRKRRLSTRRVWLHQGCGGTVKLKPSVHG